MSKVRVGAKELDAPVTEHYLRSLAPYTSGNQTFTDAFIGAADLIATMQARIEALEAQLTALREGVQKHKDSFLGKESDIVPEDGELWALLE